LAGSRFAEARLADLPTYRTAAEAPLAPEVPLAPEALEAALRAIGAGRYHNLHRFHRRLHAGGCTIDQVRAWALNRYFYQSMIPVKDATLLSRMDDPALRREWRERIIDHDGPRAGEGTRPDEGGIAKWLALTDSLGFTRSFVTSTTGILPATRFAVEAYVNFCRDRTLLEGVASSLTELFSPKIIGERVSGMLSHYEFVSRDTLAYFTARPVQAKRDSDFALDYVKTHARTLDQQRAVLAALTFKCDVLWAQLDALWGAYVEGAIPPGAWDPAVTPVS
jgi:coenzyme PQQ biosynthesis protein C